MVSRWVGLIALKNAPRHSTSRQRKTVPEQSTESTTRRFGSLSKSIGELFAINIVPADKGFEPMIFVNNNGWQLGKTAFKSISIWKKEVKLKPSGLVTM